MIRPVPSDPQSRAKNSPESFCWPNLLVSRNTQTTALHSVISVSAVYLVSSRSLNARARLLLRCSVRYCYKATAIGLGGAARARKAAASSLAQSDRLIFAAKTTALHRLVDDGNLIRAGSRRDKSHGHQGRVALRQVPVGAQGRHRVRARPRDHRLVRAGVRPGVLVHAIDATGRRASALS